MSFCGIPGCDRAAPSTWCRACGRRFDAEATDHGSPLKLGSAHPETLIEDKPTRFGSYRPENFDRSSTDRDKFAKRSGCRSTYRGEIAGSGVGRAS